MGRGQRWSVGWAVLAFLSGAFLSLLWAHPLEAQDREARVDWLRSHVAPIRSIDPADEDFSDLRPLAEAIGDARIVQLGESSHGAGATFAAKARLIKFLHQELGFDVLVWESSLFGVETVDEALRDGQDPVESARLGVFTIWSGAEEVAPLFRYAAESHSTDRPLTMTGFDLQFSGRNETERLEERAVEFVTALADPEARRRGVELVEETMARYRGFDAQNDSLRAYALRLRDEGVGESLRDSVAAWRERNENAFAPRRPDLDGFIAVADRLLAFLREELEALEAAHGPREVAFMERVLGDLRIHGVTTWERRAADVPQDGPEAAALRNGSWNRRDTRNAENLTWLLEERYAGRKVIVWAHNGHIMNAHYAADWGSLSHEPQEGGMTPMGVVAEEEMGDRVYSIGFTAFEGAHAMVTTSDTVGVYEAPEGSLEELLHSLGHEYLFLDFNSLEGQPDHWLRGPVTMAIRGYIREEMPDWTRVVDGIFYIDTMTAATPVER